MGWERVGAISADEVYAVARQGIEEVASGAPADAGGAAVAALRKQVWGRLTTTTPPVPAGGAFAAYVLGFVQWCAGLRGDGVGARSLDAAVDARGSRPDPLTGDDDERGDHAEARATW